MRPITRPLRPARAADRAGSAVTLNLPKVPGHGEDADPILQMDADGRAAVGVFDGLGGSGSTRCDGADGVRSGAYYGARVARDAADAALRLVAPFGDATPDAVAHVVGMQMRTALNAHRAAFATGGSTALRSSLFRPLPTTAAIAVTRPEGDAVRVTLLWAGDSRCYALTQGAGLQQLTADHLATPEDALANLTSDAPIARCLSADAVDLESCERVVPLPAIILAATDGCFGYLATPMHFEALLLETMAAAASRRAWQGILGERIAAVAGDDASMALVTLGWLSHGALRRTFRARLHMIRTTCLAPLAAAGDPERARRAQWAQYAPGYEAHLRSVEPPCT